MQCLPEGDQGAAIVRLQLSPVHPPSHRVNSIGGVPHDHGRTPVVLKQGPILAEEPAVRTLQHLPSALRPDRANEELTQKSSAPVVLDPVFLYQ